MDTIAALVADPELNEGALEAYLGIEIDNVLASISYSKLRPEQLEEHRNALHQVLLDPALQLRSALPGKVNLHDQHRGIESVETSEVDPHTLSNPETRKLHNQKMLRKASIKPQLDVSTLNKRLDGTARLRKDVSTLLGQKLFSMFASSTEKIQGLIDRIENYIPYCYMREDDESEYVFQYLDYVKLNKINHLHSLGQEQSEVGEVDEALIDELDSEAYQMRDMMLEVPLEDSKHEPVNRAFHEWLSRYEQNLPEKHQRRFSDVIFFILSYLMPSPVMHYIMLQRIPRVVLPKQLKEARLITMAFDKVAPHQDNLCRLDVLPIHQEIGNMALLAIDQFPITGSTFQFLKEYAAKRVSVGSIQYGSPSSVFLGIKTAAGRLGMDLPMKEELNALRMQVERYMIQEFEARKAAVHSSPQQVLALITQAEEQKKGSKGKNGSKSMPWKHKNPKHHGHVEDSKGKNPQKKQPPVGPPHLLDFPFAPQGSYIPPEDPSCVMCGAPTPDPTKALCKKCYFKKDSDNQKSTSKPKSSNASVKLQDNGRTGVGGMFVNMIHQESGQESPKGCRQPAINPHHFNPEAMHASARMSDIHPFQFGNDVRVAHPRVVFDLAQTKALEGRPLRVMDVPVTAGQVVVMSFLMGFNSSEQFLMSNHKWTQRAMELYTKGDRSCFDLPFFYTMMVYYRIPRDMWQSDDPRHPMNKMIKRIVQLPQHVTPRDPDLPNRSQRPSLGAKFLDVVEAAGRLSGQWYSYGLNNLDHSAEAQHGYNFGKALERAGLGTAELVFTSDSSDERRRFDGSVSHEILSGFYPRILDGLEFTPIENAVAFINQVAPLSNVVRTPPYMNWLVDSGSDVHIAPSKYAVPGTEREVNVSVEPFGDSPAITYRTKATINVYAVDYHTGLLYCFQVPDVLIWDSGSDDIVLSAGILARKGIIASMENRGIHWKHNGAHCWAHFNHSTISSQTRVPSYNTELPSDVRPGKPVRISDDTADAIHKMVVTSKEYQCAPVKQWPVAERKAVEHPRHQESAVVTLNTAFNPIAVNKLWRVFFNPDGSRTEVTVPNNSRPLYNSLQQDDFSPQSVSNPQGYDNSSQVSLEFAAFNSEDEDCMQNTTQRACEVFALLGSRNHRWQYGCDLPVAPDRHSSHDLTKLDLLTPENLSPTINAVRLYPVSPTVPNGTVPYYDHCILNHVSAAKVFDTVTGCTISAYDKLSATKQKEYSNNLNQLQYNLQSNDCLSCALQKGKLKGVVRAQSTDRKASKEEIRAALQRHAEMKTKADAVFEARMPMIQKMVKQEQGAYHLDPMVNSVTSANLLPKTGLEVHVPQSEDAHIEVHDFAKYVANPTSRTVDETGNILRYNVAKLNPYEHFFIDIKDLVIQGFEGSKFAVVLVDYKTCKTDLELLKKKSDIKPKLVQMVVTLGIHKLPYQCTMHYDGDPVNTPPADAVCSMGIAAHPTIPYRPNTNRAELAIQHITKAAKKFLLQAQLHPKYLGLAMKYAAYVHQYISLDSRGKLSPYQLLYGQKPDISHLKLFGLLAVIQKSETKRKDSALNEREPRQALSKGEIGIFVGCGVVRRGRVIPQEKVYTFLTTKGEIVRTKDVYWLRHDPRDRRQINPKTFSHMDFEDLLQALPDPSSVMKDITDYAVKTGPTKLTDEQLLYAYKTAMPDLTAFEDELHDIMIRLSKTKQQLENDLTPAQIQDAQQQVPIPDDDSDDRQEVVADQAQDDSPTTAAAPEEGKPRRSKRLQQKDSLAAVASKNSENSTEDHIFQLVVNDIVSSSEPERNLHQLSYALAEDPNLFADGTQKDMSWSKALKSPVFRPKAEEALASEKHSLINEHKILIPLEKSNPEYQTAVKQAVKCRALLDIKRDGRVKARIVKQGFLESSEGEGFISAQVISRESVNTLLASHRPPNTLATMDVSTAFLQADKFPKGKTKYVYFVDPVTGVRMYFTQTGPLYGERSAPMRWLETISKFICDMHNTAEAKLCGYSFGTFMQGHNDICIFYNQELSLRAVLYVDDIMLSGKGKHVQLFYKILSSHFKVKELQMLSKSNPIDFLGMIISDKSDGVQLSMEAYTEKTVLLLDDYINKPVVTPYDKDLAGPNPAVPLNAAQRKLFMTGLGMCGWLASCMRFDIKYAYSAIAAGMANPLNEHMHRLKRLVAYLKGTTNLAVCSSHNPNRHMEDYVCISDDGLTFSAFCDANKGGDFEGPDKGKPRYGAILLMNGLPIMYKSTTVGVAVADPTFSDGHVDTSTGATETYAIGNFTHALMGHKHKCHDLGLHWPAPLDIYTDNTAAQRFSEGCTPPRSKLQHIAQHQEWVTLVRDHKLFNIKHVNTKENVADIFTKAVTRNVLEHLRDRIMIKL